MRLGSDVKEIGWVHQVWLIWGIGIGCGSSGILVADCPEGLTSVPKENPEFCVQPFEAKISEDGTAVSQKDQTPDIHVSFVEAQEVCQKTTIGGRSLGLINHMEWKLAGGGGIYPWGESHEERCILDSPKTHGIWKTVQPSGSMEGCVSEHGVYDQIGNAWEWVDLKQTAVRDAWISYLEAQGHSVKVSQTLIQVKEGTLAKLQYNAVCVDMKGLVLDQDLLSVDLRKPISKDCLTAGHGYLWYQSNDVRQGEKIPEPGSLLPVKLWGNRIVWDKSRDGESVGAKVGGSFYSGGESTLNSFWVGHIPSFDGSIGVRCVQRFD